MTGPGASRLPVAPGPEPGGTAMLRIPFSHRHYNKLCHFNPFAPATETVLLGYTVVHRLSQRFIEYDTAYWPDGWGIWRDARFFPLGPSPYLILFLRSIQPPMSFKYQWTTVRCPWRRLPKPADGKLVIPGKYREARGKRVRPVLVEEAA